METVNIRDLRGARLRDRARQGELQGITNHRQLIGVVVPVAAAWVEHLIDYNVSRVRQSIAEAEQVMAAGAPMTTLDAVITGRGAADDQQPQDESGRPSVPLVAVLAGGTVTQAPESREIIGQLQAGLNPAGSAAGRGGEPAPSMRTVRVGDLSARLIEQAGEVGQTIAITHDRELIGIVVPVTQDLVKLLIEQNMSRVLENISLAEKQLKTGDSMVTIDQALGQKPFSGRNADHPLA
jgi:antitoxin (DNA-binding transcriptional repressor) of toxin-antitoxin stability system